MKTRLAVFNKAWVSATGDNAGIEVFREFATDLENGTFSLFETVSCCAPLGEKNEANEEWLYKYCRSGKTLGYAESFSDAWGIHTFKDEFRFALPQAFCWRVLCDLHKRFARSLAKGACRLSMIYFDDAAGPGLTLSASGQTFKAPMRVAKEWQTASFDLATAAFQPAADGAHIVIQNTDNPVSLHMVQIERVSIGAARTN